MVIKYNRQINEAIKELKTSGEYDKILQKWKLR